MSFVQAAVAVVMAWCVGGLPFGVWIGRGRAGLDVRQHGSGSSGMTNVGRVIGAGAGRWVLVLDLAKGVGAVLLARAISGAAVDDPITLTAGIAAVLVVVLGGFLALLSYWLARQFQKRNHDPAAKVYATFCAKLVRQRLTRGTAEAPRDFARRVARTRPDLKDRVRHITELYLQIRYLADGTEGDLSRLKFLVNELQA